MSFLAAVIIGCLCSKAGFAQITPQEEFVKTIIKGGLGAITAERELLATPDPEKAINPFLARTKGEAKTRLWLTLAKIPANPEALITAWKSVKRPSAQKRFTKALNQLPISSSLLAKELDTKNNWTELAPLIGALSHKTIHLKLPEFLGQGTAIERKRLLKAMANKPHLAASVANLVSNEKSSIHTIEDGWRFLEKIYPKTDSAQKENLEALANQTISKTKSFVPRALAATLLLRSNIAVYQENVMRLYTDRLQSKNHEDIALRRVIASAATKSIQPSLEQVYSSFLADSDPEVRASGHTLFSEHFYESQHVQQRLPDGLSDPWPRVQIQAIGAMVARCQNPVNAKTLETSFAKIHERAFSTYVSGLLVCGSVNRLLAWVGDPKLKKEKRLTIAKQLVSLAPKHSQHFRSQFKTWFRQRLENKTALKLATIYTFALGKDKHEEARASLVDAASDPAFPELVAASIRALASDCRPKHISLFQNLSKGYEAIVVKESQSALRVCRKNY